MADSTEDVSLTTGVDRPPTAPPGCPLRDAAACAADTSCPEDLVRSLEELQEQYQRCAQALATAAHDLRTPLAIITGYVELLLSRKLGPLTTKQNAVLQEMQASGDRLQRLVSDFLTFSGLQTGRLQLQLEDADIDICLEEIASFWTPRFQEKGIAFYFIGDTRRQRCQFDHDRLQRVLSNLLENASKFTPAGGTVWLHSELYIWERRIGHQAMASERRKRQLQAPNAIRITVADTGPGIPAEFHQDIFNDFFQLTSLTGGDNPGVGLGLASARRLIQAHCGKIWVESEPGSGCKMCVLLPLRQG